MIRAKILDWTDAQVQLKFDEHRDVKYQVYRDGMKHFLEMRSMDEEPIHTLELPDGMKLNGVATKYCCVTSCWTWSLRNLRRLARRAGGSHRGSS